MGRILNRIFLLIILLLIILIQACCNKLDNNHQTSHNSAYTNSIGIEMVWIEPGTFTMGSPTSEPSRNTDEIQHQVTVSKGF